MLKAGLLPLTRVGGAIRVDARKPAAAGTGARAHFRKRTWPGADDQTTLLSGKESARNVADCGVETK
jgi:hypothetical protein